MQSATPLYLLRLTLGAVEAGFSPGTLLCISRYGKQSIASSIAIILKAKGATVYGYSTIRSTSSHSPS